MDNVKQITVKTEAAEVSSGQQFFALLNLVSMFLCGWTLSIATGYMIGEAVLITCGYVFGVLFVMIYFKAIKNYTRLLIFNAAIAILIPALLFGAAVSFWYTGPITLPRSGAHK
jgi:uncharacterized YccA/Bax inhibitor family protein